MILIDNLYKYLLFILNNCVENRFSHKSKFMKGTRCSFYERNTSIILADLFSHDSKNTLDPSEISLRITT